MNSSSYKPMSCLLGRVCFSVLKASSVRAINYFMRKLYAAGMFIAAAEAYPIIQAGKHFLEAYGRLALLSHQAKESRFASAPKCHMLFHSIHWMDVQYQSAAYVENPIGYSCAQDEDFIGKFCYLTRCVSPRSRIRRSLERYFTQVFLFWLREK